MSVSPDALLAAARQVLSSHLSGISNEQAVVIGYSQLIRQPLDPELFDDSALILRAERLVLDGLNVAGAVATAREEFATWNVEADA